jgi:hypothetical protein
VLTFRSGSKTNHLMLCRKISLFVPRAIQSTETQSGDKTDNFEMLNIVLHEETTEPYRVKLHKVICQGI